MGVCCFTARGQPTPTKHKDPLPFDVVRNELGEPVKPDGHSGADHGAGRSGGKPAWQASAESSAFKEGLMPFVRGSGPVPDEVSLPEAVRNLQALGATEAFHDQRARAKVSALSDGRLDIGIDAWRLAAGLAAHIDATLKPVIEILELARVEEEANEGTKAAIDLLTLKEFLQDRLAAKDSQYLRPQVLAANGGKAPAATVSGCVRTALDALAWLHEICAPLDGSIATHSNGGRTERGGRRQSRLPQGQYPFHVQSINKIFAMTSPSISDPSAGMQSVASVISRFAALRNVLQLLGILPPGPAVELDVAEQRYEATAVVLFRSLPWYALSPVTKGGLLYVDTMLLSQHRCSLSPIDRDNVLDTALAKVKELELFSVCSKGTQAPQFYRIFPFFKLGDTVEAGEGHGPRKEFFDLAAEEMMREWGATVEVDRAFAVLTQGSAAVNLTFDSDHALALVADQLRPGCRMHFRLLPDNKIFTATLVEMAPEDSRKRKARSASRLSSADELLLTGGRSGGPATLNVRIATPAPSSHKKASFAFQRAIMPLFRVDPSGGSSYCWFNASIAVLGKDATPSHSANQSGTEDFAELRPANGTRAYFKQRFAFAGWLAAQAIANGVTLPLPLPSTFFSFLLADTFRATEDDILELDSAAYEAIHKIRQMNDAEFREMLVVEDVEGGSMTKEEFIQLKINEIVTSDVITEEMKCLRAGFFCTGILCSTVFNQMSADDLHLVICGRHDDGVSDFDFRKEFRVVLDQDFSKYPHNAIYTQCLWDVIDQRFSAVDNGMHLKRVLLKFITGRVRLPARKGEEVIRVELPYHIMSVSENDEIGDRLPQSHTCDNTLELPNYCEAMLFGSESTWYKKKCAALPYGEAPDPSRTFITETDREMAASLLSDAQTAKLRADLAEKIYAKLLLAVTNTASYDLDQPLVSHSAESSAQPSPTQAVNNLLPTTANTAGSGFHKSPSATPQGPSGIVFGTSLDHTEPMRPLNIDPTQSLTVDELPLLSDNWVASPFRYAGDLGGVSPNRKSGL
eukprot:TRINITY_DN6926_c0_g1_i1.p1 TRINITY_DN6926_c0_g1~~TRINITY_DN6926_c0_g1_i1.p1  ORF type:complete len:1029 (+),score=186.32 TRINITY_DN6926_c0_g1_i1:171-3257(+)